MKVGECATSHDSALPVPALFSTDLGRFGGLITSGSRSSSVTCYALMVNGLSYVASDGGRSAEVSFAIQMIAIAVALGHVRDPLGDRFGRTIIVANASLRKSSASPDSSPR